ncbi:GNAT family N-acetyltransferase [Scandinavium goeteborgense]|uniref:GNAT family acetyltransferase n=1 Tax=Scandinavium goeteborgense TaxID=1851514 RepID=A0A4R6DWB3_SCAGO|nr:GNAT family N-acetyltransferase [Scandinavium goeteborgense]TDN49517.1 GNAT family acetyltransferase [Scandinavium goeteborgense]
MDVRRFMDSDEIALLPVFLSSVRNIASRDYTPEQIEAWAPTNIDQKKWFSHIKELRPFVVTVGEEIVGYADVQSNGYIDNFFVSGTWSKQGVGTLLMNRIHEEARMLGIVELSSDVSVTAESFFLHHGFHVVERRFPVRYGVILQNALMQKDLQK